MNVFYKLFLSKNKVENFEINRKLIKNNKIIKNTKFI